VTVDNPHPAPAGPAGRNLPLAIVSGVALAVAFIGSLVLSPWLLLAFIGVLLLIALFELDRAFREHGLRPGTPVAVGAGFVMFFGSYPDGRWYVFLAVLFAVFNDIGAYAVGMRFGRHKMAPTVSPAKSWEGLAGGILAATVVALVVAVPLVPDLRAVHAVVLAVGASVAGTLGDLAESMVKRDLGVKDLGSVLPGHGGIMDRADAIIFALPMTYLLLDALGVG